MGVKYITNYLNERDKHGAKVSDWAQQHSPGYFECKYCVPTKPLSLKEGKSALMKHSQSANHIANVSTQVTKGMPNLRLMICCKNKR